MKVKHDKMFVFGPFNYVETAHGSLRRE